MNQSTCALSANPGECSTCTRDDAVRDALYVIGLEPSHLLLVAGVSALVTFILGMTVGVSL